MHNLTEEITRILGYASLSPSSHNSQPWMVKIQSPLEFIIQSDKSRWLPEVDPTNREEFLSLSAFAETLVLASAALGINAELTLIAKDLKDTDVFNVKIKNSSPKQKQYLQWIKKRVTTRRNFEKKEIPPDVIQEILKIDPDNILYFSLGSFEGKWIAENLPEAFKQQTFNEKKQMELSNWLRFSKSEVIEGRDGITAEALGTNWIEKFVWYNFFNRKTAMWKSFRKKSIEIAKNQVNNCSGFLIITSKDSSLHSIFESGRIYQRVGIELAKLNIVQHSMSQILQEEPWSSKIQSNLKTDRPIQLVMRIGYGKSSPTSIRRPVQSFVVYS